MPPTHDLSGLATPERLASSPIAGSPAELFEALTGLMLASKQGFALFDDTDRLRFANPVFRNVFEIGEDYFPTWAELMRQAHRGEKGTSVESEDFETWLRSAQSRRGKLPYRTIESDLRDGRWVLTTETTLAGGWMLCVFTDISELGTDRRLLRQERDKALKSAWSDELTGLSNRRYLMEKLKALFGESTAITASVVLLDIDLFKQINDTYGHDFGDRVLCHFGSVLQRTAGRDDLFGRFGGEEFLLVISSVAPNIIHKRLDALYSTLRGEATFHDLPEFRYSCSAGVAIVQQGESVSQALKRADDALYQAKAAGRDRYSFAP